MVQLFLSGRDLGSGHGESCYLSVMTSRSRTKRPTQAKAAVHVDIRGLKILQRLTPSQQKKMLAELAAPNGILPEPRSDRVGSARESELRRAFARAFKAAALAKGIPPQLLARVDRG
jgi:hypothetical protein